jgi:hypothetical protein
MYPPTQHPAQHGGFFFDDTRKPLAAWGEMREARRIAVDIARLPDLWGRSRGC